MKTPFKQLMPLLTLFTLAACSKENLGKPPAAVTATTESRLANDSIFIGAEYGGGIIYWIDETGQHGRIAAKENVSDSAQWAADPRIVTGASKQKIGTGAANTRQIIAALGDSGTYAALLCANYRAKGYSDWFLPSIEELQQLMLRKDIIPFPPNDFKLYTSSSEPKNHTNLALCISYYGSENVSLTRKNSYFHVRAVRQF